MQRVFAEGGDPHADVARSLRVIRGVGKTLNFLVIYGGGVRAITKLLRCDEATARAYLDGYFRLNPGFAAMAKGMEREAKANGFIRYETGRIRRFNTYKRFVWEMEPRKAMNSYIQGSAAEMLRIALDRVETRLVADQFDAYLLAQVHDSALLEVAIGEGPRLYPMLVQEMTGFAFSPAPMIEVKTGDRWAPMQPLALAA